MIVQMYEITDAAETDVRAGIGVDHTGVLVGKGPTSGRELSEGSSPEYRGAVQMGSFFLDQTERLRPVTGLDPDFLRLLSRRFGLSKQLSFIRGRPRRKF